MKELIDFFYETGQLKRVKRSGWWLAGVKDPESVADHSFRTAIIGYFLAKEEGVDANTVMMMCLFNDIHEARLNDLHKMGQKYIDFKTAEKKAFADQMNMIGRSGEELNAVMKEYFSQESKESIVARDADLLECVVQAKEYIDIGHKEAQNWIDNTRAILHTKTAKEMLKQIEKSSSQEWYKNHKKIER